MEKVIVVVHFARQNITKSAIAVHEIEKEDVPLEWKGQSQEGMSVQEFYKKFGLDDKILRKVFPHPNHDRDFREGIDFPVAGDNIQKISNFLEKEIFVYYSAEKDDPILLKGHYVSQ